MFFSQFRLNKNSKNFQVKINYYYNDKTICSYMMY